MENPRNLLQARVMPMMSISFLGTENNGLRELSTMNLNETISAIPPLKKKKKRKRMVYDRNGDIEKLEVFLVAETKKEKEISCEKYPFWFLPTEVLQEFSPYRTLVMAETISTHQVPYMNLNESLKWEESMKIKLKKHKSK